MKCISACSTCVANPNKNPEFALKNGDCCVECKLKGMNKIEVFEQGERKLIKELTGR